MWNADADMVRIIRSSMRGPATFTSDVSMCKFLNIKADHVEIQPDARARAAVEEVGAASSADLVAADESSALVQQTSTAAEQARDNLQRLSGSRGAGAVSVAWTVRGILLCLQLASCVRPGVSFSETLACAARMFFGSEGEWLANLLESSDSSLPMPSACFSRSCRIRLDLCNVHFERLLPSKYFFLRYLSVDSSPQLGRNYLCAREDRFRFPIAMEFDMQARSQYDLNVAFETRILPLSTLGKGHSSGLKNAIIVGKIFLMESHDDDHFHRTRSCVFGLTTDQGAERSLGDEGVSVLERFRDRVDNAPGDFLFPKVLLLVGHLHLLFNALEEACKSLPIAVRFFDGLKVLCSFLGNKELRRKFQANCLHNEEIRSKFDYFHGFTSIGGGNFSAQP